jgi:metallothiol transferase
MLKPRGLRHIALKTRDLKATERFYTGLLGLKVVMREQGMLGLESPGGEDFWNFFPTKKEFDPEAGGLDHFGIKFDEKEFRRVRAELKKAGVKIKGERGRWSVYIKDPNGYTVELHAD